MKHLREKAGLRKKDFADKLGVTPAYVSKLERPFKKGDPLPSEEVVRKVAEIVGNNEREKREILINIYLERIKLTVPDEVSDYINDLLTTKKLGVLYSVDSMPEKFRSRLKKDIKELWGNAAKESEFYKRTGLNREIINNAIEGKHLLSKRQVAMLALALRQPLEEYLLLADYVPDVVADVIDEDLVALLIKAKDLNIPQDFINNALKSICDLLINCKKDT
jgi:transcriptional regulator with XRE-family HTH domain